MLDYRWLHLRTVYRGYVVSQDTIGHTKSGTQAGASFETQVLPQQNAELYGLI